jgi:hypothetical protein
MFSIHRIIADHGTTEARNLVSAEDRHLVDMAVRILSEENGNIGITYTGFCLASLPHKRLPDDQPWERKGPLLSLLIEPGRLYRGTEHHLYGVPYGSRARMILIYLQTQALRHKSPNVQLGRSMHAWMSRMNLPVGGKSYRDLANQAARISACRMTFAWHGSGNTGGWKREQFVDSGLNLTAQDPDQPRLWDDEVRLSNAFYQALCNHPVPIYEPAIRELSNNSMALDIYSWLAYRLHVLDKPASVTWSALHTQFGAGYKLVRQFRPRLLDALKLATAVYPEAKLDVEEDCIKLFPSRPPIPERHMLSA